MPPKKRSRSAKGRKRSYSKTKRTSSAKGFKRRKTSTKFKGGKIGFHHTFKAGARFATRRKNAVPANKAKPDETTTWLGGEIYLFATDIASDSTDYVDWSLNNPIDWVGTGAAVVVPGWTQNVAQYNFYRPLGSETSVHIWQIQGATSSEDQFAGFEVALVPMDAASTPVSSGTAFTAGVITSQSALFWRNTWPHTTGRVLSGSDFNSNSGHATLKGGFTCWSSLTGQFSKAERYDPVFLTARAAGLSSGKICSWNLVITTINPVMGEVFGYQAVIKVRHKIEFSVKDTTSYTFDEARCAYLKALKFSEVYRVVRHINGKFPRGHPERMMDKPIYIGISDTPGESKGESKEEKDVDVDMTALSLKPYIKTLNQKLAAGPGGTGIVVKTAATLKK